MIFLLESFGMVSNVITFIDVTKTFTIGLTKKSIALSGLTFAVDKSEVFGIVGPNGAGKSTALKILMGFVRADGGTVDLGGLSPDNPSTHAYIGYLPENPCLYENLTVIDHLRFAARVARQSNNKSRNRIEYLLDLVNLSHAEKLPIRGYSKGMTQRAALACALFHEPEILVLDEPMSGLDPLGRQLVVDIIQDYNKKGHTVLFCSHILTDVARICSRIGIMNKGRLAALISPDELDTHSVSVDKTLAGKSPFESFFLKTIETD